MTDPNYSPYLEKVMDTSKCSNEKKLQLQLLGQMAAKVAHEIRNPLGGIQGFASLLYNDVKEYTHLKYFAQKILEGTRILNKVVEDVLEFTRPCKVDLKETCLALLVMELSNFAKATFPKNITLTLTLEEELPLIMLDEELIKLALLNLFRNAIEAMPKGGEIFIILKKVESKTYLEVKDTGIGIEEEHLKELFSPFFTTKEKGNGFGLSEISKIIQAHNGTIEVLSQKNHGTSFIICL